MVFARASKDIFAGQVLVRFGLIVAAPWIALWLFGGPEGLLQQPKGGGMLVACVMSPFLAAWASTDLFRIMTRRWALLELIDGRLVYLRGKGEVAAPLEHVIGAVVVSRPGFRNHLVRLHLAGGGAVEFPTFWLEEELTPFMDRLNTLIETGGTEAEPLPGNLAPAGRA